MFTTPWLSQSVAGGPVFTHLSWILPCWLRSGGKGYKEWKRNRKNVSHVGMGMILVSLLVCLLGQWGSWWYYRIACSRQGSCEPWLVLRCTYTHTRKQLDTHSHMLSEQAFMHRDRVHTHTLRTHTDVYTQMYEIVPRQPPFIDLLQHLKSGHCCHKGFLF